VVVEHAGQLNIAEWHEWDSVAEPLGHKTRHTESRTSQKDNPDGDAVVSRAAKSASRPLATPHTPPNAQTHRRRNPHPNPGPHAHANSDTASHTCANSNADAWAHAHADACADHNPGTHTCADTGAGDAHLVCLAEWFKRGREELGDRLEQPEQHQLVSGSVRP